MKSINPYLTFKGRTEKAFNFYQSVFGGDLQIDRYSDLDDNMGAVGDDLNLVANAALSLGAGTTLFGSDILDSTDQNLTKGTNFYINLETDTEKETRRLFDRLSAEGEVQMPLEQTGWAKKFGMLRDKFGIGWMLYYTG
ncbi:VOC family protein [Fodinibius sediminis]|nr:VOC family protein [Fodinibius sediminis]